MHKVIANEKLDVLAKSAALSALTMFLLPVMKVNLAFLIQLWHPYGDYLYQKRARLTGQRGTWQNRIFMSRQIFSFASAFARVARHVIMAEHDWLDS